MVSPRSLLSLTDDLLEEIFLRIGSPANLARASTACVAFRRLIAGPSFLRRYRSLHPPLLLGFLGSYGGGFQPIDAPHPSAALARAVARAADFSFDDYFPRGTGADWLLWDVRDGLVLLKCRPEGEKKISPDLAVCDPLARRCLLLPPIPDDFLAPVQMQKKNLHNFRAFLAPPGNEEDDMFRVIARVNGTERVAASIFSSATGHWSAGTSVRWDSLSEQLDRRLLGWRSDYAFGCFYWRVLLDDNKWIKFDMSALEFSAVHFPHGLPATDAIIVEAGEGRHGMVSLINDNNSLCYTIPQIGAERSDQLKMDNIIPLPVGYYYRCFDSSYEGHVFIIGYRLQNEDVCFELEIKTLKIERVSQIRSADIFPYFGFPPSMSQRRI